MHAKDAADRPGSGLTRPAFVPPGATRVTGRDFREVAHRYGVLDALLGSGLDAARVQVFHDQEGDGVHWVVTLDGGRTAVLTDDTEQHVGHLEGPWPFKALFIGPDGVRTEIDHSVGDLTAHVVRWCTGAAGPRTDPR
ncbi:hypothetical protein ACF1AE_25285 [Streptomyces sp. NPDC014986]|uniref:hypothetical protein n=1 Tax=Streptomyces sp. NPDC014986 TaxID=3364934 RepID=UPI0036FF531A